MVSIKIMFGGVCVFVDCGWFDYLYCMIWLIWLIILDMMVLVGCVVVSCGFCLFYICVNFLLLMFVVVFFMLFVSLFCIG